MNFLTAAALQHLTVIAQNLEHLNIHLTAAKPLAQQEQAEAEAETVEVSVPSVLYSRFITGSISVILAWLASFGLYES